ncbi:hypothetical protein EC2788150_5203 [Escherichia coli 2788150]|nr:hypothetical protein EC2788150_5203 [Escherichia coli 2788150]
MSVGSHYQSVSECMYELFYFFVHKLPPPLYIFACALAILSHCATTVFSLGGVFVSGLV